jgi:hypothetical protein
MHAPLSPDESSLHKTWRHPEGGQHYFNSNYARQLIETFNRGGDEQAINELLRHVEPLAKSILEYRCTNRYESVDELMSKIRVKIWKSARLYDPGKGTAFSFVARIIQSISCSAVADAWNRSERFCELNGENYYQPCKADGFKSSFLQLFTHFAISGIAFFVENFLYSNAVSTLTMKTKDWLSRLDLLQRRIFSLLLPIAGVLLFQSTQTQTSPPFVDANGTDEFATTGKFDVTLNRNDVLFAHNGGAITARQRSKP